MYEIIERYEFTATHRLSGLHRRHPCAAIHLHRWSVSVALGARRLPMAESREPIELEPLRRQISWELDGKYLNDIWPIAPTPARVAEHLLDWCKANLGYAGKILSSITVAIEPSSNTACLPWGVSSCRVRP